LTAFVAAEASASPIAVDGTPLLLPREAEAQRFGVLRELAAAAAAFSEKGALLVAFEEALSAEARANCVGAGAGCSGLGLRPGTRRNCDRPGEQQQRQ
jgi:hypothetical protein